MLLYLVFTWTYLNRDCTVKDIIGKIQQSLLILTAQSSVGLVGAVTAKIETAVSRDPPRPLKISLGERGFLLAILLARQETLHISGWKGQDEGSDLADQGSASLIPSHSCFSPLSWHSPALEHLPVPHPTGFSLNLPFPTLQPFPHCKHNPFPLSPAPGSVTHTWCSSSILCPALGVAPTE